MFYKVSDKDLLKARNKIFVEKGIPALNKNGFIQCPYSTSWYGKNDIQGYTYELCRLTNLGNLEIIKTHIVRGDRWIQIFLNVFKLIPKLETINQLKGLDGIKFSIPPNSLSEMKLRSTPFYKGIPLFYMMFYPEHKIKSYYTKNGYQHSLKELELLIEKDMENIESFVKRWHELYQPIETDWQGGSVSS